MCLIHLTHKMIVLGQDQRWFQFCKKSTILQEMYSYFSWLSCKEPSHNYFYWILTYESAAIYDT